MEMPTTEHLGNGEMLEMPTEVHQRAKMDDGSRRKLVG